MRHRILAAEADHTLQDELLAPLRHAGHDVQLALSGAEVLEKAPKVRPHVIVMNAVLPGLDGRAVAPVLRVMESTKTVPILLYDASCAMGGRRLFPHETPAGVTRYLSSVDGTSLLTAVCEAGEGRPGQAWLLPKV